MSGVDLIVDRLSRLVHDEIAAIGTGKLETVRELYPQKLALMQELEASADRVEKQLAQGGSDARKLQDKLQALQVLLQKDHELLERMTAATGRVAKELARIRDRHSLGGLYESSGSLRNSDVPKAQQVDQSI